MYSMDESPYPTRVYEIIVQYAEKAVGVTWLRDLGIKSLHKCDWLQRAKVH